MKKVLVLMLLSSIVGFTPKENTCNLVVDYTCTEIEDKSSVIHIQVFDDCTAILNDTNEVTISANELISIKEAVAGESLEGYPSEDCNKTIEVITTYNEDGKIIMEFPYTGFDFEVERRLKEVFINE